MSEKIVTINKGDNIKKFVNDNFNNTNSYKKFIYTYYYKFISFNNRKILHYGDFKIDKKISFNNLIKIASKPSNILNKITIVEGWSKIDLKKELSKFFQNVQDIEYFDILADTYYFEKNERCLHGFKSKTKVYKKPA